MNFFSSLSTFHTDKSGIQLFSDPLLKNEDLFFSFDDMIGKSIIITGESESGKTQITAEFVRYCTESPLKNDPKFKLLIFDMAPKRFKINNRLIGGKIDEFFPLISQISNVIYYNFDNIIPARSNAKTKFDIIDSCAKNFKEIDPYLKNVFEKLLNMLKSGINEPICIVINDLSIFFHLGSPYLLIKLLKMQKENPSLTIFLNSYQGSILINDLGSNISNREKIITNIIKKHCEFQIFLKK